MLDADFSGGASASPAALLSSLLAAVLAATPHSDRQSLISLLVFWRELPRKERALLAKTLNPDLSDEEVARLSGVSRRSLYRWEKYQRLKAMLCDRRQLACGRKSKDGELEAWAKEE